MSKHIGNDVVRWPERLLVPPPRPFKEVDQTGVVYRSNRGPTVIVGGHKFEGVVIGQSRSDHLGPTGMLMGFMQVGLLEFALGVVSAMSERVDHLHGDSVARMSMLIPRSAQ